MQFLMIWERQPHMYIVAMQCNDIHKEKLVVILSVLDNRSILNWVNILLFCSCIWNSNKEILDHLVYQIQIILWEIMPSPVHVTLLNCLY